VPPAEAAVLTHVVGRAARPRVGRIGRALRDVSIADFGDGNLYRAADVGDGVTELRGEEFLL
jgi:hypothetical protein